MDTTSGPIGGGNLPTLDDALLGPCADSPHPNQIMAEPFIIVTVPTTHFFMNPQSPAAAEFSFIALIGLERVVIMSTSDGNGTHNGITSILDAMFIAVVSDKESDLISLDGGSLDDSAILNLLF